MSKKLYTINSETFEVKQFGYQDVVSYYKNIFGSNYIAYIDAYYFRPTCTETEYYFSRKFAVKKANELLKEYVCKNEKIMKNTLTEYYEARKIVEALSGKVIQ